MKAIFTLACALIMGLGAVSAQYFSTTPDQKFTFSEKAEEVNQNYSVVVKSVDTAADGVITAVYEETHKVPGGGVFDEMKMSSKYKYNPVDQITTHILMDRQSMIDMLFPVMQASAQGQLSDDQIREHLNSMKITGEITVPVNPNAAEGQVFEKSRLRCFMGEQQMNISLSKGTYLGSETIETEAGKFDCVKLSYQMKTAVVGAPQIQYITAWYAPGIGAVKTVSGNKKDAEDEQQVIVSVGK